MRSAAGFDGDGSFGDVEFFGEEFEEGGVGFAVVGAFAKMGDVARRGDFFQFGALFGAGFDMDGDEHIFIDSQR